MIALLGSFVGLSAIVIGCGVVLAKSADRVGERFGLGASMAGFLLLAGATSLPELVLSVEAARLGDPDLAFGDLLGSCLFNLFILGLLDLLSRSRERMLSTRSAAHALSATVTILLAAVIAIGVLLERDAEMLWSWWPETLSYTAVFIIPVYLLTARVVLLDMTFAGSTFADSTVTAADAREADAPGADGEQSKDNEAAGWKAFAAYLSAAGVLLVVGPLLAAVTVEFADQSGLGGTFVGTTFVAAVTSLPEVVTTYAALRIGAPDLAVGNVLGSNAFNLVMLTVVDAASPGRLFANVLPVHAVCALSVIVVTTVAVIGILYRAERRVGMIEPDAAAVVGLSLASFALVYVLS